MKYKILSADPAFEALANGIALQIDESDCKDPQIVAGPNYYDAFGRDYDVFKMRLNDFLSLKTAGASRYGDVCPEFPAPSDWASAILLDGGPHLSKMDGAYAMLHAGLEGAIAPLHFDWDFVWVVNASLKGRKSFIFVPPSEGWMLSPVMNTSALGIPRFEHKDRAILLERLGGREIKVPEGSAVLFPSTWWHGVMYEEPSVAISVRFAGPRVLRPLGVLPRCWWLQRLAWSLWHEQPAEAAPIVQGCLESFFAPADSWEQRYERSCGAYRSHLRGRDDGRGREYLMGENFNIERAHASGELAVAYDLPPDLAKNDHPDEDVKTFLFGACFDTLPHSLRNSAVNLAVSRRQGLRPKRGLLKTA